MHRLALFDGHLFAAYGDYGANTGPIHALRIDPATLTVVDEATLATEETWPLRVLPAGLFVPYVDPRGGNEATTHYARRAVGGSWSVDRPLALAFTTATPEHVFDAAQTVDGLWMAGAAYGVNPGVGGAPTIWRSVDDGVTWTTPLLLDDVSDTGFARVYGLATIGDEVVAVIGDSGTVQRQFRWAGSTWTEEAAPANLLSDSVEFSYNGTPFALAWQSGKRTGAVGASPATVLTRTADAGSAAATIAATLPAVTVMGAIVAGGDLWILDVLGVVHRGQTDGTWTVVTTPASSYRRCMAVDVTNGWLFFGTWNSRIERVPIP